MDSYILTTLRRQAEDGQSTSATILGDHLIHFGESAEELAEGITWLRTAIAQKDAKASYLLGMHLVNGHILNQDTEEGEKLLTQAISLGDTDAMWQLGLYYLQLQDPNKKLSGGLWLKKAAEAGHALAMYELARRLLAGDGVAPNQEEGESWMKKAADQQIPQALSYFNQKSVEENVSTLQAEQQLHTKEIVGKIQQQNQQLMQELEDNRQKQQAKLQEELRAIKQKTALNDTIADYLLDTDDEGLIYLDDDTLQTEIDRGNLSAMVVLATYQLIGNSDRQANPSSAERLYQQAVDRGSLAAMTLYGMVLCYGYRLPADKATGLHLLHHAAAQGDRLAQRQLDVFGMSNG